MSRGMCQVYWGTDKDNLPATGIPIDLRMGGVDWHVKNVGLLTSIFGWEEDAEDDEDLDAENDKKLRNNMVMKAPQVFTEYNRSRPARAMADLLRKIVVREEMKADETYYVRFRSVLEDASTEFAFDFFELCPKEVYDNPETPEDMR